MLPGNFSGKFIPVATKIFVGSWRYGLLLGGKLPAVL